MKKSNQIIHLICNAHLDPVWLWQWEEGLNEALSTFRLACEYCEHDKDFIFCHNESLLYEWVEEHAPKLFKRIQRLVKAGKWHIEGGSFIQPDINMPSGESHIRQFITGKKFFQRAFGVNPTTAYNFDSFGQAEGYPQILKGCGFDSYIFCRPWEALVPLPAGPFLWQDRSCKGVVSWRGNISYTTRGDMHQKLERDMPLYKDQKHILLLWGIGNHGGGGNHEDMKQVDDFCRKNHNCEFVHSTPENFFKTISTKNKLPIVVGEMQKIFQGCYTSASRIKLAHRKTENLMFETERMAAMAWWLGKGKYPATELEKAWKDILFGEFHDILPGSMNESAGKDSLNLFAHAEENLRRIRLRIFMKTISGQAPAEEGETPLFVWNPHGFDGEFIVETTFTHDHIPAKHGTIKLCLRDWKTGKKIVFQQEQSEKSIQNDWQMKVVFRLKLPAFGMRRIEASWKKRKTPKLWKEKKLADKFVFNNVQQKIILNAKTGLIDFVSPGKSNENIVGKNSLLPIIFEDLSDSWRCGDPNLHTSDTKEKLASPSWNTRRGNFRLATRHEAANLIHPPSSRYGICSKKMPPVRIIEEGPIRTIIEAIFVFEKSFIIRRYVFSRNVNGFDVHERIFWNEPDAMLKIALPASFAIENTIAETPYSAVKRPVAKDHEEHSCQRWVAALEKPGNNNSKYLAVVNSSFYGYSCHEDILYLSLLRSPAYGSSGLTNKADCNKDRYWPRHSQGEHEINYGIRWGARFKEPEIIRDASLFNIRPAYMAHFPTGTEGSRKIPESSFIKLSPSNSNIEIAAIKKSEKGNGLIVRLRETAGYNTSFKLKVAGIARKISADIKAYNLLTLRIERKGKSVRVVETNLIETPVWKKS